MLPCSLKALRTWQQGRLVAEFAILSLSVRTHSALAAAAAVAEWSTGVSGGLSAPAGGRAGQTAVLEHAFWEPAYLPRSPAPNPTAVTCFLSPSIP